MANESVSVQNTPNTILSGTKTSVKKKLPPNGKNRTSPFAVTDKNTSPMEDKHIFSPEPDNISTGNEGMIRNKGPGGGNNGVQQGIDELMQKVKREMELTGIIITPASRKAMILYKGGNGKKKQEPELYGAGASIDEYLLKDIFPNYIVVTQNNVEVKIELFKERTNRPESPKEVSTQQTASTKKAEDQELNGMADPDLQPDGLTGNGENRTAEGNSLRPVPVEMQNINTRGSQFDKTAQGNASDTSSNPFARGIQDGNSGVSGNDINSNIDLNSSAGNPFLQAIQRAREKQKNQQ